MEWKLFSLDGLRARDTHGVWQQTYLLPELVVEDELAEHAAGHWISTTDPDDLTAPWERLPLAQVLARIPREWHSWACALQAARIEQYEHAAGTRAPRVAAALRAQLAEARNP